MEVKLIGSLNYNKVREILKESITDENKIDEIIESIKRNETERRSELVSTAGRLSRFSGSVLEVLQKSEGLSVEKNSSFASRVISMGHKSISEHDYLVFALKDVSVAIEQSIIEERFSSFTIKSRREANFANAGYYVPNFHDKDGNVVKDNKSLQSFYKDHMNNLFSKYSDFVNQGINVEDARFVLPYCFNSNIMMGINAHTLMDMIIKFTKTKYSRVEEFKEFGDKLYEIAKEQVPYIIPYIDAVPSSYDDEVSNYLADIIEKEPYQILDHVKLLNNPKDVDERILIASLMRRYQWDQAKCQTMLEKISQKDASFRSELMRKIAFEGDRLELSQVNFDFQIPISFAILTHLTRHRTHKIMVPDFFPNIDLTQYKVPPKIKVNNQSEYDQLFTDNKTVYDGFRQQGIRDEDLIYFTLAGNMTNVVTNMDGWTVRHILELRECNKAQWETREIAYGIHDEIRKLEGADNFSNILGPTCVTRRICNEGKESCGKVLQLLKKDKLKQ